MPYRRKGQKSRRYNKSNSSGRMKRTRRSSGSKYSGFTRTSGAYKRFDAKSYLPPGITRELKFYQFSNSGPIPTAATTAGQLIPSSASPSHGSMCTIAQGSKANEREGRKIVISEINLKIFQDIINAITVGSTQHRFMLVLDTQCNGAVVAANEVINISGPTIPMHGAKNHFNGERFKILFEEWWVTDCVTAVSPSTQDGHQIIKSLKVNIPITYNENAAGAGTITSIKNNNIFILYWNNQDGDTFLNCNWEIRYYDD